MAAVMAFGIAQIVPRNGNAAAASFATLAPATFTNESTGYRLPQTTAVKGGSLQVSLAITSGVSAPALDGCVDILVPPAVVRSSDVRSAVAETSAAEASEAGADPARAAACNQAETGETGTASEAHRDIAPDPSLPLREAPIKCGVGSGDGVVTLTYDPTRPA